MSKFSGHQFKGAQKALRAERREEAEIRNAASNASRRVCGHIHGEFMTCPKIDGNTDRLLNAIFREVSA